MGGQTYSINATAPYSPSRGRHHWSSRAPFCFQQRLNSRILLDPTVQAAITNQSWQVVWNLFASPRVKRKKEKKREGRKRKVTCPKRQLCTKYKEGADVCPRRGVFYHWYCDHKNQTFISSLLCLSSPQKVHPLLPAPQCSCRLPLPCSCTTEAKNCQWPWHSAPLWEQAAEAARHWSQEHPSVPSSHAVVGKVLFSFLMC